MTMDKTVNIGNSCKMRNVLNALLTIPRIKDFLLNANKNWNKCSGCNLIYEKPQFAIGHLQMCLYVPI